MTPAELEILKAISSEEVKTFLPAGPSAAEAQVFYSLVEWLQRLQRLGWIELEVAEKSGRIGKYQRKFMAAAARCTDHGRQECVAKHTEPPFRSSTESTKVTTMITIAALRRRHAALAVAQWPALS
jgi:hypothetical protein